MSDTERPQIETRRWRAIIVADFDVRDYPDLQLRTAQHAGEQLTTATQRGDTNINTGRHEAQFIMVMPIDD